MTAGSNDNVVETEAHSLLKNTVSKKYHWTNFLNDIASMASFLKRMQQEQLARMQQYQQNQGNFFDNHTQSHILYHQQNNYLDDGLQSVSSGGFSVPATQGSSQMQQMQLIHQSGLCLY